MNNFFDVFRKVIIHRRFLLFIAAFTFFSCLQSQTNNKKLNRKKLKYSFTIVLQSELKQFNDVEYFKNFINLLPNTKRKICTGITIYRCDMEIQKEFAINELQNVTSFLNDPIFISSNKNKNNYEYDKWCQVCKDKLSLANKTNSYFYYNSEVDNSITNDIDEIEKKIIQTFNNTKSRKAQYCLYFFNKNIINVNICETIFPTLLEPESNRKQFLTPFLNNPNFEEGYILKWSLLKNIDEYTLFLKCNVCYEPLNIDIDIKNSIDYNRINEGKYVKDKLSFDGNNSQISTYITNNVITAFISKPLFDKLIRKQYPGKTLEDFLATGEFWSIKVKGKCTASSTQWSKSNDYIIFSCNKY